ncbi:hypothetical protein IQ243_28275 [Nostocales cyanobacterium LEGE 11386]|nr:hypothetical protein [Nostocales cyanobacterium LEGE 11386]
MKRDIQGKFALKNDDYRLVRSLRLTDETWKTLGIAAECNGLTRADYLEQIVRDNTLPSITQDESPIFPSNTWRTDSLQPCNTPDDENTQTSTTLLPQLEALEALRDRILLELKLGKQATGYKAALKALNRFITELTTGP